MKILFLFLILTLSAQGAEQFNRMGWVQLPAGRSLVKQADPKKANLVMHAPANFMDKLSWIESRNEDTAIGDHGKAFGRFQITERALIDVNKVRRQYGLDEIYHEQCFDPGIGREAALHYIAILTKQLHAVYRRAPSEPELLAAFQLGFRGFKDRRFVVPNSIKKKLQ